MGIYSMRIVWYWMVGGRHFFNLSQISSFKDKHRRRSCCTWSVF